jgi:hypothetical protein
MFLHGMKRINDMRQPEFISLDIKEKNGAVNTKFVNKNCIQMIWQEADDIIIELTDFTQLRICNQNIHIFMDRFK